MFLKISQNSQENTIVGVSFLINFINKWLQHLFSSDIWKIFENTFSTEHLQWLLLIILGSIAARRNCLMGVNDMNSMMR